MSRSLIVLIAGPTASGKSALALALAERLGGTVINADSMQVYRELRLLTARPTPEDEARVPHRLYGVLPARQACSAGEWLALARAEIGAAFEARRTPIVVGGTGLYFKALTGGLADMPPIPEAIRAFWRNEARRVPADALHDLLRERDPQTAAKLHPSDPQRIVRALEVLEATGRPLSDWQRSSATPTNPLIEAAVRIALRPNRAWLEGRIAQRAPLMLTAAAIEEVQHLSSLGLDPQLPAMKAIGVKEIAALVTGRIGRAETQERIVRATRRYAKRQMTWIRGQMTTWAALDPSAPDPLEAVVTLCTHPA